MSGGGEVEISRGIQHPKWAEYKSSLTGSPALGGIGKKPAQLLIAAGAMSSSTVIDCCRGHEQHQFHKAKSYIVPFPTVRPPTLRSTLALWSSLYGASRFQYRSHWTRTPLADCRQIVLHSMCV